MQGSSRSACSDSYSVHEAAPKRQWPMNGPLGSRSRNPQARSASEGQTVLAIDAVSLAGASGLFSAGAPSIPGSPFSGWNHCEPGRVLSEKSSRHRSHRESLAAAYGRQPTAESGELMDYNSR